ncbi:MAG: hypothetical protein M1840_005244 [Geoglossum simile]|nr:MAG: hypothetical protein M1840_005244 [Geoglossum simile]
MSLVLSGATLEATAEGKKIALLKACYKKWTVWQTTKTVVRLKKRSLPLSQPAMPQREREDDEKDGFHEADLEAYLGTGHRTECAYQFFISIRHVFCSFVTEGGHIGIGSRKVHLGDEIWLLFGGKALVGRGMLQTWLYAGRRNGDVESRKAGKLKNEWLGILSNYRIPLVSGDESYL